MMIWFEGQGLVISVDPFRPPPGSFSLAWNSELDANGAPIDDLNCKAHSSRTYETTECMMTDNTRPSEQLVTRCRFQRHWMMIRKKKKFLIHIDRAWKILTTAYRNQQVLSHILSNCHRGKRWWSQFVNCSSYFGNP